MKPRSASTVILGLTIVFGATTFPHTAFAQQCPPPPDPLSDLHWTGLNASASGLLPDGAFLSAMDINNNVYVLGYVGSSAKVAKWDGTNWAYLGERLYSDGGQASFFGFDVTDNGDVYVGGQFTHADNGNGMPPVATQNIARWDAVIGEWTAVGRGTSTTVFSLKVDDNSDVVYGSAASAFNPDNSEVFLNNIGRWNITLSQWEVVGGGVGSPVQHIAVDTGGDIYVVGQFDNAVNPGGVQITVNGIARWDGSMWHTLGQGLNREPIMATHGLRLNSTGILYLAGEGFDAVNADGSIADGPVVKWDGSLWTSIPVPFGYGFTFSLVVDGTDIVHLLYLDANFSDKYIISWDGTQWTSIAQFTGTDYGYTLAANPGVSGMNLYTGGLFFQIINPGSGSTSLITNNARWNGMGWSEMVGPTGTTGNVFVLEADDTFLPTQLYVGGLFSSIGGQPASNFASFNGSDWTAGFGPNGPVHAIAAPEVLGGPVIVGGEFTEWVTETGATLQALNIFIPITGGGSQPGVDGPVYALLNRWDLQFGHFAGKLIVGGAFTTVTNPDGSTLSANGIARWDYETERWEEVGNGLVGTSPVVYAIAEGPHELGGIFYNDPDFFAAGVFDGGMNTDGSTIVSQNIIYWKTIDFPTEWLPVGQGVNGLVRTIASHKIGTIPEAMLLWAGGDFSTSTNPDGTVLSTPFISFWDFENSRWVPLAAGLDGPVYAIAPDAKGYLSTEGVYIGGDFTLGFYTNGNVLPMSRFGFVSPFDAQVWSTRGTNNTDDKIRSLAAAGFCYGAGENVYTGGDFQMAGFRVALHLARWYYKYHPCHFGASGASSTHTSGGGGSGYIGVAHNGPPCSPLSMSPGGEAILIDSLGFLESVSLDSLPLHQYLTMSIFDAEDPSNVFVSLDSVIFESDQPTALIVVGVADPTLFVPNPEGRSIAMTILSRPVSTQATQPGNVELLFVNAVTDAPSVDIMIQGGMTVVDSLPYGEAAAEQVSLVPGMHTFDVIQHDNGQILGTYTVDMSAYADQVGTVLLSGFLDPEANQNGPAMALDILETGVQVVDVEPSPELADLPSGFSLGQNYPNPFNPTTAISFSVPPSGTRSRPDGSRDGQLSAVSFVELNIYDVLGREVATLVNEKKEPGTYEVTWDAVGLASGVYFYRLKAGEFAETKRLVLLR